MRSVFLVSVILVCEFFATNAITAPSLVGQVLGIFCLVLLALDVADVVAKLQK